MEKYSWSLKMNDPKTTHLALAQKLAAKFSFFPSVEAVAIAGSVTGDTVDPDSDIDLYVFTTSVISLPEREAIVDELGASRADMNLQFWDLGDEWYDAETGIEVDVIYWDTAWIEGQVSRVLEGHQASVGYTTCFWGTVKNSLVLFDRSGWLHTLKEKYDVPYPEELRKAVITKNHPVLRNVIPAYFHQIEKAIKRNDLVSINHRVAALLASYFDVIFAINRIPHPGEKRMLEKVLSHCEKLPDEMAAQVNDVLGSTATVDAGLLVKISRLLDGLDALLITEGFDLG